MSDHTMEQDHVKVKMAHDDILNIYHTFPSNKFKRLKFLGAKKQMLKILVIKINGLQFSGHIKNACSKFWSTKSTVSNFWKHKKYMFTILVNCSNGPYRA